MLPDTIIYSPIISFSKRSKVDASIFDSALSHTRRSDATGKREENSVSTFGRFRLWTSFESSPVSLKFATFDQYNDRNDCGFFANDILRIEKQYSLIIVRILTDLKTIGISVQFLRAHRRNPPEVFRIICLEVSK